MSGLTAEQLLQQRLLRSRLRGSAQHLGGGPPPQPLLPPPLSPPSPPDSPPPGTTPAEIPAGPRCTSETWCSFCRMYCPEPVCLPCGHNFCTGCIGQRLGEPKMNISCLECGATARKRNLRPIKPPPLLSSLGVDRAKRQRLDSAGGVATAPAAPPAVVAPPPPPVMAAATAAAAASGAAPVATTPAAAAAATAAPPQPLPLLSLAPTPPTPPTPKPPTPPPAPAPPAAKRATAPLPPTSTGAAGDASGGRLCDKHREVLQFFCEEDQAPICAHCDRSQEHRAHTIFHVERAARDYRVQTQLETLKQEKNSLWSQKLSEEKKIQEYMEKAQAERQEIISEFECLHQFLKDQEQRLLTRLEELEKEIEKRKEESVTRFSEELSRLGDLLTEMEVKSKQPASEFLQMYFQVLQPGLKAVEKLAWMMPFLQVHAGTHRVWLPGRPLLSDHKQQGQGF